jgi:hypothetical protein
MPDAIEGELIAHLLIKYRVGQRIGRELVLQEAANNFFRVDDWVQGHRAGDRLEALGIRPEAIGDRPYGLSEQFRAGEGSVGVWGGFLGGVFWGWIALKE